MATREPLNVYLEPKLSSSSLIVGWNQDAGRLGPKVMDYLIRKLGAQEFAEIEPVGFFPLDGVHVEANVATFPESKFYYCRESDLVLFKSALPTAEWYRFLNLVLDVAERYCNMKEFYSIGGMVAFGAHTVVREIVGLPNSPQMKQILHKYGLAGDMDYETPPGQGTTLNSFLLGVAKKRGLVGAGIWTSVPFYLAQVEDPQACKMAIGFLEERFNLGIDLADLEQETARQSEKIAQLRFRFPEIDDYIRRVESNLSLGESEIESLVARIEECLNTPD